MKTNNSDCDTKSSDFDAYESELKEADMTMNNNLMFRSMFFMNDEARHFLAPALPLPPCESEYFQKKASASISSSPGNSIGSQNTGGSTQLQDSTTEKPTMVMPKQRPHSCEECGKTFLMKHHLTTHMRVHTGERPHVCPECGKSFALKHCLSTHLLLHTSDRPYKCPECSKTFTLKHHLVSHERVHSRDRPFECPECGRRFPQKRHLTTHIKFHSGERPFSCQVCDESFSREEHLVMHSRFHGGQRPFICPDCGAGFLRKFELVNHERQHGRNPEACPVCGKEFLQKRTLLVHVRTCGLPLPYNPPTPTQSLSPSRFTSNENASLAVPNKTCKECGETFASVEGLALHLRLHFGDHSFLSDICSLAASLKQSAVNAALSLSLASKKTHICSDCGRGFTQKHGLFTHKQRHENGSCKLKPFACEKCGKCFAQKNHLSLHERQHMDLPNQRNASNESILRQNHTNQIIKDDPLERSNSERNDQEDDLSQESEERLTEQNQSIHIVLNNERNDSIMQTQNQTEHNQRHNSRLHRNEEERHIDHCRAESLNHHSEDSLVDQCHEPIIRMDLPSQQEDDLSQESEERLTENNQSIHMVLNNERNDSIMQTQNQTEHNQRHNSRLHRNEEERHIDHCRAESLNHHSEDSLVDQRHEPIIRMDLPSQQGSSNDSLAQENEMEHGQHDPLRNQPVERYLDQHRHSNNDGQHSVSLIRHQNSNERLHSCESLNSTTRSLGEQRRPIPLSLVCASMDHRLSISLARQTNHNDHNMETQDMLSHHHHMNPSPPLETPHSSTSSFQHASASKHQY